MKIQGIYLIRNTISGRVYVGSSYAISQRWNGHRHALNRGKHHAPALQRSWIKHSPSAFSFEVLEVVECLGDMLIREQHWIDLLYAACPRRGFNAHPNAGGPRGHKLSAKVRAKMSADRLGRKLGPLTAAHRAAISAVRTGSRHTAEACAKMSEQRKGRKKSPEHDAKIRAQLVIRNQSSEMKAATADRNRTPKMRAVTADKNRTPEMRAKVSAALKARLADHNHWTGRKHSAESLERMRVAAIAREAKKRAA